MFINHNSNCGFEIGDLGILITETGEKNVDSKGIKKGAFLYNIDSVV